jgi:hypothetical protein
VPAIDVFRLNHSIGPTTLPNAGTPFPHPAQLAFARSVRRTASIDAALALVLSSPSYGSAYLIIGVATELRYLFWSLIAIFTALVISLSDLRIPSGRRRRIRLQGGQS